MSVNENYKQALRELVQSRETYKLAEPETEAILYHRMKAAEERVVLLIKEGKVIDNN